MAVSTPLPYFPAYSPHTHIPRIRIYPTKIAFCVKHFRWPAPPYTQQGLVLFVESGIPRGFYAGKYGTYPVTCIKIAGHD